MKPARKKYFGGIEAGGSKFICAIANSPDDIYAKTRFDTTTPEDTLSQAVAFFHQHNDIDLQGIGIACFGPLDLQPPSDTFGFITNTPKPGWPFTDMRSPFAEFGVPVQIDTDVNGAALGEQRWGAAAGLDTFLYLTIGTGIGGGGLINGDFMHGLIHPEMGHILIPHDHTLDPFEGCCPFHGDCLEGLASGLAIEKRWGISAKNLPPEHPAWELEAHYLAMAVTNFILTLSPQRIIMGGGVMKMSRLIERIRELVMKNLNKYVDHPLIKEKISNYIILPELGDQAGLMGAIALAQRAEASAGLS